MTTAHIAQNVFIGGLYIVLGRYFIREIVRFLKKPIRIAGNSPRLYVRTLVHLEGYCRSSGVWVQVEAGR